MLLVIYMFDPPFPLFPLIPESLLQQNQRRRCSSLVLLLVFCSTSFDQAFLSNPPRFWMKMTISKMPGKRNDLESNNTFL